MFQWKINCAAADFIFKVLAIRYVKNGVIKVTVKGNGRYDYDAYSVYRMLNKDIERKTYVYARVSTSKQKADLENQITVRKSLKRL